jgi:thiol-disulfide isomerase/thioredoxin
MPGFIGYIMYLISTVFGILLFKFDKSKRIVIIYSIIFMTLVSNYYNLYNFYYSKTDIKRSINKNLPVFFVQKKNGGKFKFIKTNKILVIDLWSINCSNCIKSFPQYEKIKNTFKNDKEIEFISINIYETLNDIEKSEFFLKGYTFKNYYSDKSLFEILDFNSVPNYLIVGKDNKIKYFGNLNVETYETYNNIYKLIENEK